MAEYERHWTDSELGEALRALAGQVRYPDTPDLASAVRERIEARSQPVPISRWRPGRFSAIAAALTILALGVALAFPQSRSTVAGWLNLPGVVLFVETDHERGALGGSLRLGEPITLDEARSQVAFPVLVPDLAWLGDPDEVYLDIEPSGGAVSFIYRPSAGLPATKETGVGALLSQFEGWLNPGMYAKGLPSGVSLETFEINGQAAFWISGDPHSFSYVDPHGRSVQVTVRMAGNTLLWQDGDLTLRLESALDRDAAVAIAQSMR